MGSSGYEREKVGSEVWGFSKHATKGKARAIEKVIERQERGWGWQYYDGFRRRTCACWAPPR